MGIHYSLLGLCAKLVLFFVFYFLSVVWSLLILCFWGLSLSLFMKGGGLVGKVDLFTMKRDFIILFKNRFWEILVNLYSVNMGYSGLLYAACKQFLYLFSFHLTLSPCLGINDDVCLLILVLSCLYNLSRSPLFDFSSYLAAPISSILLMIFLFCF